jgi:hypothetical protein
MTKSVGINTVATTLMLYWIVCAFAAQAQAPQWCPPSGMTIIIRNGQGEMVRTTRGADPMDSTVCVADINGPAAGISSGKTVRSIYGWYPLQNIIMTPETERQARVGLGEILSGKSQEFSFTMTTKLDGRNWTGTESWRHTGQATIPVAGRSINVITVRQTYTGNPSTPLSDAYWNLWYDPALHFFVKGERYTTGGPLRGAFDVISISPR